MRILFCIENNDEWILKAYEALFDALCTEKDIELFCTTKDINNISRINNYNLIDYSILRENLFQMTPSMVLNKANEKVSETAKESTNTYSVENLIDHNKYFRIVLALIQPDLVITWNGMCDVRKMAIDFSKEQEIPSFYAEKGLLPDSWYIDEVGINATSSLNESIFKDTNFDQYSVSEIQEYVSTILKSGKSAWEQPDKIKDITKLRQELGINNTYPILFFPGQVDEDINIIKFSSFENVAQAVEGVLLAMPETLNLLVKIHPKSKQVGKKRVEKLKEKYKNLYIVENINVWDAIEMSDLVISINSTVAFEALLKKKKVIILGDYVLNNLGITQKTEGETLKEKIKVLLNSEFNQNFKYKKLMNILAYLKEEYYCFREPTSCMKLIPKIWNKVNRSKAKLFTSCELKIMFNSKCMFNPINIYGRKSLTKKIFKSFIKN